MWNRFYRIFEKDRQHPRHSRKNGYEENLVDDGVENILKYGIACYKKRCRVMLAENIDTDKKSRKIGMDHAEV